jgi:DNA polymerase
MHILFGDWETYFDNDYTLTKQTPAEYVLDPRFESLGCAFCREKGPSHWVDGPDLPDLFRGIPWDDVMFVSHNALFDACILGWRYHVKPRAFGDTVAMARVVSYHQTGRVSLAKLAEHYGLPAKGTTTTRTKGRRLWQIKQMPLMYDELRDYARDDVEKCRWLFFRAIEDGFPIDHLEHVDTQIRMAVQPQFVIDHDLLTGHLSSVLQRKADILAKTGLAERAPLMSNDQFAELLLDLGVDPPMKVSPKGNRIFAFAKSDLEFTNLLEHEDEEVRTLVEARLAHKTTLEETRAQRLINIANVHWLNGEIPGSLPIPLKYAGAHTGRYSGDWNVNLQNLPRPPFDNLRKALKAPPGKLVVSVDASQIEARLNAALAGQNDLLEHFKNKRDVYAEFASRIYNMRVSKDTHPRERQLGKVGILSLGYGAGWRTFQNMVRNQSNREMTVTDDEALTVVQAYRNTYPKIVATWEIAGDLIEVLADGPDSPRTCDMLGPVEFYKGFIRLPNGHRMFYNDLERQEDRWGSWTYRWGTQIKYLYGPKVIENVIQSLAFVHIMEVASRVKRLTRNLFPLAHQVHDELLYVVPESDAEAFAKLVKDEMRTPPKWMPEAPLDAEAGIGASYGEC